MRPLAVVLAAATLTASAGCGLPSVFADKPPSKVAITGTLTIRGGESANGEHGEPCEMRGGYKDIRQGAQVVVTDTASKTIAVGQLDGGRVDRPDGTAYPSRKCVFSFALTAPAGHDFYGVEISHRGRVQYSADQIKNSLELTLDD